MAAVPESRAYTGYLYGEEPVRAVRPRPRAKVNGSLVVMVLVIFLAGLTVGCYYSQLYTLNYQLDELQKEIGAAQAGTQDLNASLSRFDSLSYVEEVATTKLGMVKATGESAVRVSVTPPAAPVVPPKEAQVEKQVYAAKNPVIDAFYQMVSRFEQKIRNG